MIIGLLILQFVILSSQLYAINKDGELWELWGILAVIPNITLVVVILYLNRQSWRRSRWKRKHYIV